MTPRTSLSHPLRIDEVQCAPSAEGVIGITFCPGKQASSLFGAPWQRDLEMDLKAVSEWGAHAVLSMIEEQEMSELGVPELGSRIRKHGIEWHHLPIVDQMAPGEPFDKGWPMAGRAALQLLRTGGRVLVHCRGGLGRAGTVAACLLMELGVTPTDALRKVRAARPGAVETLVQERFLSEYRARLDGVGR